MDAAGSNTAVIFGGARAATMTMLFAATHPDRARALETLTRAGLLDDERFARGRATALAARGYGDAAIGFDLERQGVAAELATGVLEELEPERDRAVRVAAAAGGAARAARVLARRGFGEDAIEAAVGHVA